MRFNMISIIAIISVLFIAGCSSQIEETQPEAVAEENQVSNNEENNNLIEDDSSISTNQDDNISEDVEIELDNDQNVTNFQNYDKVLSFYVELGCSQASSIIESDSELSAEEMSLLAQEAAEKNNIDVNEANTLAKQYSQDPEFIQDALKMIMNTCPEEYNALSQMQTQ